MLHESLALDGRILALRSPWLLPDLAHVTRQVPKVLGTALRVVRLLDRLLLQVLRNVGRVDVLLRRHATEVEWGFFGMTAHATGLWRGPADTRAKSATVANIASHIRDAQIDGKPGADLGHHESATEGVRVLRVRLVRSPARFPHVSRRRACATCYGCGSRPFSG